MELNLNNDIELKNNKDQNNFLNTILGKAIDNGIDIGLRCILPNYLEEGIIELKDNLINYGLKNGISKSLESVIDTGKNIIGIITGDFENISQVKNAIKRGGIIDSVSELLDDVFDKVRYSGKVNNTIMNLIENGKDSILNNIENNIEDTLNKQIESIEDLEDHINDWKEYYNNKDFNSMEKEYKKIQNELRDLIPIQNTLNEANKIEILHNLIKNNNGKFNLLKEELELAEKISNY